MRQLMDTMSQRAAFPLQESTDLGHQWLGFLWGKVGLTSGTQGRQGWGIPLNKVTADVFHKGASFQRSFDLLDSFGLCYEPNICFSLQTTITQGEAEKNTVNSS